MSKEMFADKCNILNILLKLNWLKKNSFQFIVIDKNTYFQMKRNNKKKILNIWDSIYYIPTLSTNSD